MKIGAGSVIGSNVPVGAASAAAFFLAASSIAAFFAASSVAFFKASTSNDGAVAIFFTPLATAFFCPVKLLP